MEDREAEEKEGRSPQARPPSFQLPRHRERQVENPAGLITLGGPPPVSPMFQDKTHLCGAQGLAQEAGNLQGCPSLLPTGGPQRLRNKGARSDSCRLLQSRRPIPHSLRGFARAVPSAWETLPPETCRLPCLLLQVFAQMPPSQGGPP